MFFSRRNAASLIKDAVAPPARAEGLTFSPKITNSKVSIAPQKEVNQHLDIPKLCKAISYAETAGCKDGTARGRNNCHGIMAWDKAGNRYPRYFKTQADSFKACEELWARVYKRYPDYKLAHKWTGGDNTRGWLATVNQKYAEL